MLVFFQGRNTAMVAWRVNTAIVTTASVRMDLDNLEDMEDVEAMEAVEEGDTTNEVSE